MKEYEEVKSTLRWRLDKVEEKISNQKKTNKLLHEYIDAKREELTGLNRKNLKSSYEVEELKARILEIKKWRKME